MYMVEKLDAGDILTQVEVPISETDTVGTLHDKLSEAGAKLLSETLPKLLRGELTPVPQNEEEATYAYNITREQEKIDWTKTGEEIYNHIRGFNPWPVAYTTLNGKTIKIWRSVKVPLPRRGLPGEIVSIDEEGFTVCTGNETGIKIIELQPSGKRRMSAAEYLRGAGAKLAVGNGLGDKEDETTKKCARNCP